MLNVWFMSIKCNDIRVKRGNAFVISIRVNERGHRLVENSLISWLPFSVHRTFSSPLLCKSIHHFIYLSSQCASDTHHFRFTFTPEFQYFVFSTFWKMLHVTFGNVFSLIIFQIKIVKKNTRRELRRELHLWPPDTVIHCLNGQIFAFVTSNSCSIQTFQSSTDTCIAAVTFQQLDNNKIFILVWAHDLICWFSFVFKPVKCLLWIQHSVHHNWLPL